MNWAFIENAISGATGQRFIVSRAEPVGGGWINGCWVLSSGMGQRYFVKLNRPEAAPAFEVECLGLAELEKAVVQRAASSSNPFPALSPAAARTSRTVVAPKRVLEVKGGGDQLRVPRVIAQGANPVGAFLVLEFLPLQPLNEASESRLGVALAHLHRHTAPAFGWDRDNVIGATTQLNGWLPDWPRFWRERRLEPQLYWASEKRLRLDGVERLLRALPRWLDHQPAASLVHGDLWQGNVGCLADQTPVVMDPAVYYGDREVDLAFTALFGGFSEAFYRAYLEAWPLPPGSELRIRLYNLYHELNHFNLFGEPYGEQVRATVEWLLQQA